MTHIQRKFGWIPDEHDPRDIMFAPVILEKLPTEVNLAYMNPDVYDQLQLGSCVFNSEGSMFRSRLRKQGQDFIPSRLFPYYNYREMIGKVNEDTGASMREGIKMYVKYGVVPESEWPYDKKLFATKPSSHCYTHAANHQAIEYNRINQDMHSMKVCLATGNTFVIGIMLYDSFMSNEVARTGLVKLPKKNERFLGGHAVEVIGYNDKIKSWIMKNSWGLRWGMHGYFLLPFDYLMNTALAMDAWTITLVETDNH